MKYETYRRIKRQAGIVPKVETCSVCGVSLVKANRSSNSRLCKVCLDAERIEMADRMYWNSLTGSERLVKFPIESLFSVDFYDKLGLSGLVFFRLLDCSSCRRFMSCFRIQFNGGGVSFACDAWDLPKSKLLFRVI